MKKVFLFILFTLTIQVITHPVEFVELKSEEVSTSDESVKQSKEFQIDDDELEFQIGDLYQFDILLTDRQKNEMFGKNMTKDQRTGVKDKRRRWNKNKLGKVIVPFVISTEFSKLNNSIENP